MDSRAKILMVNKRTDVSSEMHPLKSFAAGLILSAGLAVFFYSGIFMAYKYLIEFILIISGLIIICSFIFWINIKSEHMEDLTDVFFKTIAFDFKFSQPGIFRVLRFLKSLNPYIGAFTALLVLLLILWAVPAVIIYIAIYPDNPDSSLRVVVFIMSAGTGALYYRSNKDQFPSAADRTGFFAGIMFGTAAVIKIIL